MLNETHHPRLTSWVASANSPETDFPIQNLPFGVFTVSGQEDWRIGVAIGDQVVDVRAAIENAVFAASEWQTLRGGELNDFLALGPVAWSRVRAQMSAALGAGSVAQEKLAPCMHAQSDVRMRVPMRIGDYTDFYASIYHATRIGQLLRPDNPLLPNYKWVPIAYHGRSSSIVSSGTVFHRPRGQVSAKGSAIPSVDTSRRLDYELELGIVVGTGNSLGKPISIGKAEEHVFGICLLNDWSARDVQAWEYQPLGPFLAKNFMTTISPWIVSLEALEPFRTGWSRPIGDPAPLPYLDLGESASHAAIDIELEVSLRTTAMMERDLPRAVLSRSNYRDAYWTIAQMIAHHTMGGCNLHPGDLLGTGTLSGPSRSEGGCLMELTEGGQNPIRLPNGEVRSYLEDGDEVSLRASCTHNGARRIGFGTCTGLVLPANQ
jgi:fumarylacetoacetase